MLARLIYGFRISVLFGLALTIASSLIGIAAGAVQGYFGGWTDLSMQRFIEIWTSVPSLYLLIVIAAVIEPVLILLGILLLFSWVALVGVVCRILRARNFEYVEAARAREFPTSPLCAAICCPMLWWQRSFPAVYFKRLDYHPHLARFSGSACRPAHPLWVNCWRKAKPICKRLARPIGVLHHCHYVEPADFHRRGGARCV